MPPALRMAFEASPSRIPVTRDSETPRG
jgi:hypothetical protein